MSVEAESCFKPNIKKFTSELLCIMVCAAKETVCTCGVKHGIERVKEYGIQEMLDKIRNMNVKVSVRMYVICWKMVSEWSV